MAKKDLSLELLAAKEVLVFERRLTDALGAGAAAAFAMLRAGKWQIAEKILEPIVGAHGDWIDSLDTEARTKV